MHQSPHHVDTARVLVVDNDRDTAETLACLLRLFGRDVGIAFDGHRAIEVARRERPGCMVLDISLPGLDGYEVASRLRRELAGSIVLIAYTGHAREEDRRAALAAGFDHHFIKPLDPDGLNALLAALDVRTWSGPDPAANAGASTADASRREPNGSRVGGGPPIPDVAPREAIGRNGRPPSAVSREIEFTEPLGLHLRTAAMVVQLARQFRAEVRVGCGGRTASARSVLDLMTLAAASGSRLKFEADGPEAEAVMAALIDLFGRGIAASSAR